jgi:allantoinase
VLDLVFRARRVITAFGEVDRCVGVQDGLIVAIEPYASPIAEDTRELVDLPHDEVLLPGLVDTHVHVNEPGRTEWEGFASAAKAAALGGITTIIDMPLNSVPPTIGVAALEVKRKVRRAPGVRRRRVLGRRRAGQRERAARAARRRRLRLQVLPAALRVDEFQPLRRRTSRAC